MADLIVSEHYDVFAEKARTHGMGIQAESGGPHGAPLDALETFRRAAVTQTEFWSQNPHRNADPERFFSKQAASAANIYGQRFIAQEGETSIGPQWSESLATDLKPSFDMAITEGMNRLVWHEFTSSPASTGLPGQEYFAGTHLNPKVTWWNAGAAFFTYLNRVQFLMQQGTAVNDILYFYGDNVPNFVRLKADDPAHVLPGYDYDVTDEDALLHSIHMEGGKLRGPGGVAWILPKAATWIGVTILIVIVGWFLAVSSADDELDAERNREPALKQDYRGKLVQAVNLSELRKQKLQVQEYVTQLEKQLPGKAEMDALLSDINQAGLGRGLQFELFRPGQVVVKDYYAELPISIRVSGRYHDIGAFAGDIANLSRIVTLQNISIAPSGPPGAAGNVAAPGSLALEATARTYRYLDQTEIAAQRAAQAGAKK